MLITTNVVIIVVRMEVTMVETRQAARGKTEGKKRIRENLKQEDLRYNIEAEEDEALQLTSCGVKMII